MYKKTILVVENGYGSRKVQALLREHGYELRVASDKEEALQLWKEQAADYVLLAGMELGRGWLEEEDGQEECLSDEEGRLLIDLKRHQVMLDHTEIRLTPTEYRLLAVLMGAPNRIYTREQLILAVFEHAYGGYDRSIDTHIKELRHKLGENGRKPHYIQTVHGVGYKFVP